MLSIMLLLTACSTTTSSNDTKGFCLEAKSISWSATDTADTIRQIKAHNAVGVKLCGWGKGV